MFKKALVSAALCVALSANASVGSTVGGTFESTIAAGSFSQLIGLSGLNAGWTYNINLVASALNLPVSSASLVDANNTSQVLGVFAPSPVFPYTFTFGNFQTAKAPVALSITGTALQPTALTGSWKATVSAVPEPQTIAMMLAGLGVIGASVARRRKSGSGLLSA